MTEMLTIRQYSERYGLNQRTVESAVTRGRIPGVQKARYDFGKQGYRWMIPADAPLIRKKRGPKTGSTYAQREYAQPYKPPIPDVPAEPSHPMSQRQAMAFLKNHSVGMTYGQLRRITGYPTIVLRRWYDLLHEKYGI